MKCNNALEELDKTIQHLLHYMFFFIFYYVKIILKIAILAKKIVNINGDAVKILCWEGIDFLNVF